MRGLGKVALAVLALVSGCASHTTEANEVGVRVNKLTGIEDRVYAPGGTYFFMPLVNDWYTFSTKTQTLNMTAHARGEEAEGADEVQFKTRDGNDVGMDVTVLYRVDPMQAIRILRQVAKSDAELKEKVVRPLARTLVRDALNLLSSEEIYTNKRIGVREEATVALNKAFVPYGLLCENVTFGDHRFHPKYQEAIVNKKVYDQQVNTNRSAKEAASGQWLATLETVKGDVEQRIAQERGAAERTKLAADAYFFTKQKDAEGILAQKTNEAKGVVEHMRALASSGGRTHVKLRVAQALAGKKILIVPGGGGALGMQKLDLNELMRAAVSQEALRSSSSKSPRSGTED